MKNTEKDFNERVEQKTREVEERQKEKTGVYRRLSEKGIEKVKEQVRQEMRMEKRNKKIARMGIKVGIATGVVAMGVAGYNAYVNSQEKDAENEVNIERRK